MLTARGLGVAADRSMTYARGAHNVDAMASSGSRHLTQTRRQEQAHGFTEAAILRLVRSNRSTGTATWSDAHLNAQWNVAGLATTRQGAARVPQLQV